MSQSQQSIALFDFDGTLTTSDSMFAFIDFVKGKKRRWLGMLWLAPMLIRFKLGWKDRQQAKEELLYHFFKGMKKEELEASANRFNQEVIPQILRPSMIEKLRWHQQAGHNCYLVSASLDIWLRPFAQEYQLTLLSTEAHFSQGIYQRKFASPNCYGPEKLKRIQAALKGQPDYYVYAYGDSNGDREMLAWADINLKI